MAILSINGIFCLFVLIAGIMLWRGFQNMVREPLIKYLHRHAGENQHPVNNYFDWILACARMTTQKIIGT
jgi:hypothetical protein